MFENHCGIKPKNEGNFYKKILQIQRSPKCWWNWRILLEWLAQWEKFRNFCKINKLIAGDKKHIDKKRENEYEASQGFQLHKKEQHYWKESHTCGLHFEVWAYIKKLKMCKSYHERKLQFDDSLAIEKDKGSEPFLNEYLPESIKLYCVQNAKESSLH